MKKNKRSNQLVNGMWEAFLIPRFNDPIPAVSTDKIIPNIKKHGKGVKSNASK